MKYQVIVNIKARIDLEHIFEYVTLELKNPYAAMNIYYEISSAISSLDEFPERFVEAKGFSGIHKRNVGKYIIYYSIDKEKQIVTVVRILYSGVDINQVAIN